MRLRYRIATTASAMVLAVGVLAGPAFAHYCANVNKQAGAGSIGTYNADTGEETLTKKNGGFFTVFGTDLNGEPFSYDLYNHQLLPEGALASGPGGDDHCDGKGIDDALACLGIPH